MRELTLTLQYIFSINWINCERHTFQNKSSRLFKMVDCLGKFSTHFSFKNTWDIKEKWHVIHALLILTRKLTILCAWVAIVLVKIRKIYASNWKLLFRINDISLFSYFKQLNKCTDFVYQNAVRDGNKYSDLKSRQFLFNVLFFCNTKYLNYTTLSAFFYAYFKFT